MTNSLGKYIAVWLAFLLSSCAFDQPPAAAPDPVISYKTRVIDTACDWTGVITVTKDTLTEAKSAAILSSISQSMEQKKLTSKQILVSAIAQTQQDWLVDPTAKMIQSHDVAWLAKCGKPKP